MSLALLLPQVVTIAHVGEGALDADRNWVRTATTTTVRGRLELLNSTEPEGRGVGVEDRWRLYLPAGTALTAADQVTVNSRVFQVVGTPERVMGARTEHHVEVQLLFVGDVAQSLVSSSSPSGYGEGGYGLGYYGGAA